MKEGWLIEIKSCGETLWWKGIAERGNNENKYFILDFTPDPNDVCLFPSKEAAEYVWNLVYKDREEDFQFWKFLQKAAITSHSWM